MDMSRCFRAAGGESRGRYVIGSRRKAPPPLGRAVDVTDETGVVAFIVSVQASYMTGQTIVVDGGFLIAPGGMA
jgi:NAD(P)-dependent dehydrogenase (short-subunit alcohol dehydrogenase family)